MSKASGPVDSNNNMKRGLHDCARKSLETDFNRVASEALLPVISESQATKKDKPADSSHIFNSVLLAAIEQFGIMQHESLQKL